MRLDIVTQLGSRVHTVREISRNRLESLKAGPQLIGELLDTVERHHGDVLVFQQPRNELTARILAGRLDLGDRREDGVRRARADAFGGVSQHLGLRGIAAQRDGVDVSARSVIAIRVIEMQRVARLREFLDANAAFELAQNPVPPEDVVQPAANPRARVFDDSCARRRRALDVVVEEPVELGVEVIRQKARCGLSCKTFDRVWSSFSR